MCVYTHIDRVNGLYGCLRKITCSRVTNFYLKFNKDMRSLIGCTKGGFVFFYFFFFLSQCRYLIYDSPTQQLM